MCHHTMLQHSCPPLPGRASKRLQLNTRVSATSADLSGLHRKPVVIFPGFLSSAPAYTSVTQHLQELGYATSIVPIQPVDWGPTLTGGDFVWYLDKAQRAIKEANSRAGGQPVALAAFSAGGFLARLLMGTAPYAGRCWDMRQHISSLVTLGTPHLSLEQYPFGRVEEKRPGEESLGLPQDVRGSSLRFANWHYPDASRHEGIPITCVVGNSCTGIPFSWALVFSSLLGRAPPPAAPAAAAESAQLQAALLEAEGRGAPQGLRQLLDASFASVSYKANCGKGDVPGDGVCPVDTALLPGARHIILPGVWHTASHSPWYGSREVIRLWASYLV